MTKNQYGFSLPHLLLLAAGISIIGFAGWRVLSTQKDKDQSKRSPNNSSEIVQQEPSEEIKNEYTPPEGWVRYEQSPLNFYYPEQWSKEDFKVKIYGKYEYIPSGYGTPVGYKFEKEKNAWASYLNYGDDIQKPYLKSDGSDILRTTFISRISDSPIAFFESGHASYATHEVLVIHKDSAYHIRLPGVNGMTEGESITQEEFDTRYQEEAKALLEIIKSIKFEDP